MTNKNQDDIALGSQKRREEQRKELKETISEAIKPLQESFETALGALNNIEKFSSTVSKLFGESNSATINKIQNSLEIIAKSLGGETNATESSSSGSLMTRLRSTSKGSSSTSVAEASNSATTNALININKNLEALNKILSRDKINKTDLKSYFESLNLKDFSIFSKRKSTSIEKSTELAAMALINMSEKITKTVEEKKETGAIKVENIKFLTEVANNIKTVLQKITEIGVSSVPAVVAIPFIIAGSAAIVATGVLLTAVSGLIYLITKWKWVDKLQENVKKFKELTEGFKQITNNLIAISVSCVALGLANIAMHLVFKQEGSIAGFFDIIGVLATSTLVLAGLAGVARLFGEDKVSELTDFGKTLAQSIIYLSIASLALGVSALGVYYLFSLEGTFEGMMMMVSITTVAGLLLAGLALISKIVGDAEDLQKIALTLPIMIGGLSLACLLTAGVAWAIGKMGDIDKGLTTMLLIVSVGAATMLLVSLAVKIAGGAGQIAIGLAALALTIVGVSAIIYLVAELALYIEKRHEKIWSGLGHMFGILTATTLALTALGLLLVAGAVVFVPAATAVLALSGVLVAVSLTTIAIVGSVIITSKIIEEAGGKKAVLKKVSDMFSILTSIAWGYAKFGLVSLIATVPVLATAAFLVVMTVTTVLTLAYIGITLAGLLVIQSLLNKIDDPEEEITDSKGRKLSKAEVLVKKTLGLVTFIAKELISMSWSILKRAPILILLTPALSVLSVATHLAFNTALSTIKKMVSIDKKIKQLGGYNNVQKIAAQQMGLIISIADTIANSGGILARSIVKMWVAARNAKHLAKQVKYVTYSISKILSIIDKMESMKAIDHFDEKGRPVYKKIEMTPERMRTYGETLAAGILGFLENLVGDDSILYSSINKISDNMDDISDLLLGKKKWWGLSNKREAGILEVISHIVDSMQSMGKLHIIKGYNNDGTPIYASMSNPEDFKVMGATLASCITGFLSTLIDELKDKLDGGLVDKFKDVAIVLMGGSTGTWFSGKKIGSESGGILKGLGMIFDIFNRVEKMTSADDFNAKGKNVGLAVTGFLNGLADQLEESTNEEQRKKFDAALKYMTGSDGVFAALNELVELINNVGSMTKTKKVNFLGRHVKEVMSMEEMVARAEAIGKATNHLFKSLYSDDTVNVNIQNAGRLKAFVEITSDNLKKLDKVLSNSPVDNRVKEMTKRFRELTQAVKEFNTELSKSNKNMEAVLGEEFGSAETETETNTQDNKGNTNVQQKPRKYVALDSNTLNIFGQMFSSLVSSMKEAIGAEATRDIFVDLEGEILKGKAHF